MSITGNLRTLELAELLQWLAQGQKTGALVVENGKLEKRIYFRAGKIVCSESNNPEEHLGGFLVRQGLIDEATLSRAVKLQESTQILLGKVLVTLGSIAEDELHQILYRKTEESIYELFTWEEGEFHFVPDELPEQSMATLELDVTNVVLEGMKRLDEARRDAQEAGGGESATQIDEIGQAADDGYEQMAEPESEELDIPEVELSDEELAAELERSGPREALFVDREPSSEVRGYYGERGSQGSSTPMLAAAAAVGLLAVGALVYFFYLRPEPVVGIADRSALEKSAELAAPVPDLGAERPGVIEPVVLDSGEVTLGEPLSESSEPEPGQAPEAAPAARPDDSEKIQARYESELAALRQELQRAKLVAAERKAAVRMLKAEEASPEPQLVELTAFETLERQTELADSATLGPEPQEAAGGDEPPTLAGTIATRDDPASSAAALAEVPADAPAVSEPDPIQPTVAETQAGGAVAPGPGVTPPELLANPSPRYPPAALRVGKQADVTVRLLIDEKGVVREVERVGPLAGMGFDQAALMAARRTSWRPATKDGEPVRMWTELRIAFRP